MTEGQGEGDGSLKCVNMTNFRAICRVRVGHETVNCLVPETFSIKVADTHVD